MDHFQLVFKPSSKYLQTFPFLSASAKVAKNATSAKIAKFFIFLNTSTQAKGGCENGPREHHVRVFYVKFAYSSFYSASSIKSKVILHLLINMVVKHSSF